jgi:NAD(P)-dependent dehydrogenase (short-subunit alcohol dehydrogenase family)
VSFEGKSVLVTGGSRGIGLATAKRFLGQGANVTIGGRDDARLDRATTDLDGGSRVATVAADVSTVEGCRATVTAAVVAFGAIDVLVTNAGGYESAPVDEVTEDQWDRMIDAHLKGTFFCIQAALPSLRASHGCVVAMVSDAGLAGLPGGWAAYCAAKGGVVNLIRQLAMDLAPDIRLNCVAPGPVGTEHVFEELAAGRYGGVDPGDDPEKALADTVPLKRLITPEEVADAVVYVAGAESMTGSVLGLDGGSTAGLP